MTTENNRLPFTDFANQLAIALIAGNRIPTSCYVGDAIEHHSIGGGPINESPKIVNAKLDVGLLMKHCYSAIENAHVTEPPVEVKVELVPAVPIRKSVQPDHIVCLEDGKEFKSLKRHLRTHFGLTPEEYREKWGLPADYPMVAPSYSATRSKLAKDNGLGRKAA